MFKKYNHIICSANINELMGTMVIDTPALALFGMDKDVRINLKPDAFQHKVNKRKRKGLSLLINDEDEFNMSSILNLMMPGPLPVDNVEANLNKLVMKIIAMQNDSGILFYFR